MTLGKHGDAETEAVAGMTGESLAGSQPATGTRSWRLRAAPNCSKTAATE